MASLRSLLQQALRLTMQNSRASSGSILVVNEQGALLEGCRMHDGIIETLASDSSREIVQRGLAGWVLRHRRPALVANTREDARWLACPWEQEAGAARSAICVPLSLHDRTIGVLTLAHAAPSQFTQVDLEQLARMAAA